MLRCAPDVSFRALVNAALFGDERGGEMKGLPVVLLFLAVSLIARLPEREYLA